jgi:hypothetical protein
MPSRRASGHPPEVLIDGAGGPGRDHPLAPAAGGFAIAVNVLELDDSGEPVNEKYAEMRAATWIYQYCTGNLPPGQLQHEDDPTEASAPSGHAASRSAWHPFLARQWLVWPAAVGLHAEQPFCGAASFLHGW